MGAEGELQLRWVLSCRKESEAGEVEALQLPEPGVIELREKKGTKKFEFNGKEVATVDFDSSSKTASHTITCPAARTSPSTWLGPR